MLSSVLISLAIFLLFSIALGLSVIFGKKPIKGSCGGLSAEACAFCSPAEKDECKKKHTQETA